MFPGSLWAGDAWTFCLVFFLSLKGGDHKSYLLPRATMSVLGHDLGKVLCLVPGMSKPSHALDGIVIWQAINTV